MDLRDEVKPPSKAASASRVSAAASWGTELPWRSCGRWRAVLACVSTRSCRPIAPAGEVGRCVEIDRSVWSGVRTDLDLIDKPRFGSHQRASPLVGSGEDEGTSPERRTHHDGMGTPPRYARDRDPTRMPGVHHDPHGCRGQLGIVDDHHDNGFHGHDGFEASRQRGTKAAIWIGIDDGAASCRACARADHRDHRITPASPSTLTM